MQNLLRSGLNHAPEEEAEIAEQIASGVMERLALLDAPLAGLLSGALAGEDPAADDIMALLPPVAGAGAGLDNADRLADGLADGLADDPALAALLRGALADPADVADGVMGALALPALPEVGEALRAALPAPGLTPDLSGAVMAGLPDGRLGDLLRGALGAADLSAADLGAPDLSEAVMAGLPDGRIGDLLRRGLVGERSGEAARIEAEAAAEDVMDALPRPARARPALRLLYGGAHRQRTSRAPQAPEQEAAPAPSPGWRSWRPMIPVVAAMAALFLLVLRIVVPADEIPADPGAFALGETNAAEVEDVEAWAASVQVMQFEENGVTFILIDEGEPSPQAVPL